MSAWYSLRGPSAPSRFHDEVSGLHEVPFFDGVDKHLGYAADIAEKGHPTADEVNPAELFDGRVKEWVLGVVEECKEESFPFKEPE